MERFASIYPFTTENISGYMKGLDLTNKKIITVTGSADHIINAILLGTTHIVTFDVNPLTKKYMDLKLAALKELSYEEFLEVFLYDTKKSLAYNIISSLNMTEDSKKFWINQLQLYNKDGLVLKKSKLFNTKYFNPKSKLWQNMYLSKENYELVKQRLNHVKIEFISKSLQGLKLTEQYDYMFLSNISDYINLMYNKDALTKYRDLVYTFLNNVKEIYFAYLYDIGNSNPRSDIDNLSKVEKEFKGLKVKIFKSALETEENKKDGVLILGRN